jgi:hypothetical protein
VAAMMEMKSSTAASSAEKLFENIIHIVAATSTTASLLLLLHSFFSELIVGAPLVGITESLVCIRNLLELFLRSLWIIFVLVWMMLNSHFLELLLDLCVRGISADSKHFVIVLALVLGLLLVHSLVSSAKAASAESASKSTLSAAKTSLLASAAPEAASLLPLSRDHEGIRILPL